jgi:multiple antibiotic resistance protein
MELRPRLCKPARVARPARHRQIVYSYMPVDYLLSHFVTLFVVVDPIGLAPIFLSITHGLSHPVRRRIALRASLIAGAVLAGFALGGDWLLRQLGITIPAFRIAGGLLLFATAFDMVLGWRREREARSAEQAVEEHARNIAAFPLAIPLMAGPGAITATVLLAGQAAHSPNQLALLLGIIASVLVICALVFLSASRIERFLGVTGNVVLSRLLGVLLAALAVQYVIDGTRAVMAG